MNFNNIFNLNKNTISKLYYDPLSIINLYIDDDFNDDIDISILSNLEYLNTGDTFNKYIDFSKLLYLTHLYIYSDIEYNIDLSHNLKLKELTYNCYENPINVSNNILLETLKCSVNYDDPIDLSNLINLKKLDLIGIDFNHNVNLSNCILLEELRFGPSFNQSLDLSKNVNIKRIVFGHSFNHPININNLINLQYLYMGSYDFDHHLNTNNNINLIKIEFLGRYRFSHFLHLPSTTNLIIHNRDRIYIQQTLNTLNDTQFNSNLIHCKYYKGIADNTCSICKQEYEDDESITFSPCNSNGMMHCFHTQCIKIWTIHYNASCAICRSAIN